MAKLGQDFAKEMLDRGRRELAGVLYPDSNIAQPMYPPRNGYETSQEADSPARDGQERSLIDERVARMGPERDEPGRDDRGIDRE